jgi:hypothetical protein
MSPIEIPEPSIPLPLPDGFDINLIGSYAATVWELANQNSLITIIFLLLAAVAMVGIIVNLVTHRGQAAVEEEYRR